MSEELCIN
jgi:hypothetical protein